MVTRFIRVNLTEIAYKTAPYQRTCILERYSPNITQCLLNGWEKLMLKFLYIHHIMLRFALLYQLNLYEECLNSPLTFFIEHNQLIDGITWTQLRFNLDISHLQLHLLIDNLIQFASPKVALNHLGRQFVKQYSHEHQKATTAALHLLL